MRRGSSRLLVGLCVVATACTSTATAPLPGPTRVTFRPDRSQDLEGVVYVSAGPDLFRQQELYVMRFGPLAFERITDGWLISALDACADALVVAGAPLGRMGDALYRLVDGRLEPIPGIGGRPAHAPAVSEDCVVAYFRPRSQPGGYNRLMGFDLRTGRSELLLRSRGGIGSPGWGPRGALARVRGRSRSWVTVHEPGGGRTQVPLGKGIFDRPLWSRQGWIAASKSLSGRTVLIGPDLKVRLRLKGWVALDWSPSGEELLVRRFAPKDKVTLGVLNAPRFRRVHRIGTSTVGPLWEAAWLPRPLPGA